MSRELLPSMSCGEPGSLSNVRNAVESGPVEKRTCSDRSTSGSANPQVRGSPRRDSAFLFVRFMFHHRRWVAHPLRAEKIGLLNAGRVHLPPVGKAPWRVRTLGPFVPLSSPSPNRLANNWAKIPTRGARSFGATGAHPPRTAQIHHFVDLARPLQSIPHRRIGRR